MDLRRTEGSLNLRALLAVIGPRGLAAGAACMAVVFALSLSEIPVTARVYPPDADPLAVSILNAMHFQRPTTVMIASMTTHPFTRAFIATGG